ncbi:Hypothetical predicted protein [Drosophila guanche]|uniref:Uncharacterized protein n=1 Tax=Drosophila guanche TaxID=7266 RepID=A0A3B0JCW1_DROGU|nr:Hypothetical predicted protein [Drosophila guanche]
MDGSGDNQLSMQLTRDLEARQRMNLRAEQEHLAIAAMVQLQVPRQPAVLMQLPHPGFQPLALQHELDDDSGFESDSESE